MNCTLVSFQGKKETCYLYILSTSFQAALQSSASSVTLPALEWPGSSAITALLQEKLGVSPLLVDVDTLSQLTIDQSVSNLLLISLPYCTE